jgi:hypothetical protein
MCIYNIWAPVESFASHILLLSWLSLWGWGPFSPSLLDGALSLYGVSCTYDKSAFVILYIVVFNHFDCDSSCIMNIISYQWYQIIANHIISYIIYHISENIKKYHIISYHVMSYHIIHIISANQSIYLSIYLYLSIYIYIIDLCYIYI